MADKFTPEQRNEFLRNLKASDPEAFVRLKRMTFKDMITLLPDLEEQKSLKPLVDLGEFDDVNFKDMRNELVQRGGDVDELKDTFRFYIDERLEKAPQIASAVVPQVGRADKYISGAVIEQISDIVPANVFDQIDKIQNAEGRVLSIDEIRNIVSKDIGEKDFNRIVRDSISQYEAQTGQKAPEGVRRSFPPPQQQFGIVNQMSAPRPPQSAPMVQRGESVTNVGGRSSSVPQYLRETPEKILSTAPPASGMADKNAMNLAAGLNDGGKMEKEAQNLGSFLDDYPKLKRVIQGVPLGLRYGAATLPAAALLTKYAMDEADDIGERWTKNRLRAEMRKEALRKLAYSELKNSKVSAAEEPRTTSTYTPTRGGW